MFKTKNLGTDAGDRSDFKYYAYSAQVLNVPSVSYATYLAVKDNYISRYMLGMSKAATVVSGTKPVGTQTVQGTSNAKPAFNDFSNRKIHGFIYPFLLLRKDSVNPILENYNLYWRYPIPNPNFGLLSTGVPSWSSTEGVARRAWWSMQPRFEGEVSMLNFINELKDFKDLIKYMPRPGFGIAERFTRLGKRMRRVIKEYEFLKSSLTTVSGATKLWANLRLANEFALKPLIKDVSFICSQLIKSAEAAQSEFLDRGLAPQITHYTEMLDESYSGSWGTGNSAMWFTGMYQKTLFTATMQYRYVYDMREGFELFKRYWGLNVTTGVIWEAIPFSFLADYFLKIGSAINNMEKDPNVNLTMLQYCESLLQQNSNCIGIDPGHALVTRFHMPSDKHVAGFSGFRPVSGVEFSFYQRIVTSPNKGSALPRISCPTSGQQANMLALIRGFI